MNEKRWLSNGCLRAAPTGEVNVEKGIIAGVSVCTVGEAKGHGVHLDRSFIESVAKFGNEKKQGLKARFGHPNMCSTALGTFLGRFKNFAVEGDQVRADLFLSNEAKDTPHGDLYSYVMGMAKNEPDMFGTSIVFTPGRFYQIDEDGSKVIVDSYSADESQQIFVECESLHACDTVDEPAANDGMFSRFAAETVAGQITEFLDLNPQVWKAIEQNPDIMKALSEHGDKMDEFTTRYREFRKHNGGNTMPEEDNTSAESLEATQAPEVPETTEAPKATEPEATEAMEAVADANETEAPEAIPEAAPEPEPEAELSRADFLRIDAEFGSDIAAQTVRDGGTYETALRAYADGLKTENASLRAKVEDLTKKTTGGKAANVTPEKSSTSLFKTNK